MEKVRTTFRVWLQSYRAELPAAIWRGIPVVSERWHGANCLDIETHGDGAELRIRIEQRADIFSFEPPGLSQSELLPVHGRVVVTQASASEVERRIEQGLAVQPGWRGEAEPVEGTGGHILDAWILGVDPAAAE